MSGASRMFENKSNTDQVPVCFSSFQWRSLHEHGGEDPLAGRLHHRLHHRVGSGGSSDPQQPVSLPPGEPATSVQIWDTQAGERFITHPFFLYMISMKSRISVAEVLLLCCSCFCCNLSSRSPSVMGCLKTRATSSIWKGLFLWRRIHQGERLFCI